MVQRLDCSELYDWLDLLSDGDLLAFSRRMESMPLKQVEVLAEKWPEGQAVELMQLPIGQVRPLLPWTADARNNILTALRLLLYVDSVIVDSRPIEAPRCLPAHRRSLRDPYEIRAEFQNKVRQLASLRPLVSEGSVCFVPWLRPGMGALADEFQALEDLWPDRSFRRWDWSDDRYLLVEERRDYEAALANEVHYLWRGAGTPLTLSGRLDVEGLLRLVTPFSPVDERQKRASILANFAVPCFTDKVKELIVLRSSSRCLADFRLALSSALSDIASLPVAEIDFVEACAIVGDNLERHLSHIWKESSRYFPGSDLVRRLGLIGLGSLSSAATLAALGSPVLGAVSGTVTGLTTSLADMLLRERRARQERNITHAVQDIVMMFQQCDPKAVVRISAVCG